MHDQDTLFERLLTEYICQNISPEDKELLFSMILTSDRFRKKYEEITRINTLLHVHQFGKNKEKDYTLLKNKIRMISPDGKNKRSWHHLLLRSGVAAILLVLVSLGSVYVYKTTENSDFIPNRIEVSTPLGGVSRLILPDGSVAWLNAKSTLEYNSGFGNLDRTLFLTGEAYFEVIKNQELPFLVKAEEIEVVATGTMFNVRSYPDDTYSEIQLIEGGVDVLVSDEKYSLKVDEKAVYNKESKTLSVLHADSGMAIQWTRGKISFDQASMPEIYKMLERQFNVTIHIESQILREEYFFGSINLDMNLSQILSYLDIDKKYKIETKDNIIFIRDR